MICLHMLYNKCLMMLFSFSQRGKWNWILPPLTADIVVLSSSSYGTVFIYWSRDKMTVNVVRKNPSKKLRYYKLTDNLPGHIQCAWNESRIKMFICLWTRQDKNRVFFLLIYAHTVVLTRWASQEMRGYHFYHC